MHRTKALNMLKLKKPVAFILALVMTLSTVPFLISVSASAVGTLLTSEANAIVNTFEVGTSPSPTIAPLDDVVYDSETKTFNVYCGEEAVQEYDEGEGYFLLLDATIAADMDIMNYQVTPGNGVAKATGDILELVEAEANHVKLLVELDFDAMQTNSDTQVTLTLKKGDVQEVYYFRFLDMPKPPAAGVNQSGTLTLAANNITVGSLKATDPLMVGLYGDTIGPEYELYVAGPLGNITFELGGDTFANGDFVYYCIAEADGNTADNVDFDYNNDAKAVAVASASAKPPTVTIPNVAYRDKIVIFTSDSKYVTVRVVQVASFSIDTGITDVAQGIVTVKTGVGKTANTANESFTMTFGATASPLPTPGDGDFPGVAASNSPTISPRYNTKFFDIKGAPTGTAKTTKGDQITISAIPCDDMQVSKFWITVGGVKYDLLKGDRIGGDAFSQSISSGVCDYVFTVDNATSYVVETAFADATSEDKEIAIVKSNIVYDISSDGLVATRDILYSNGEGKFASDGISAVYIIKAGSTASPTPLPTATPPAPGYTDVADGGNSATGGDYESALKINTSSLNALATGNYIIRVVFKDSFDTAIDINLTINNSQKASADEILATVKSAFDAANSQYTVDSKGNLLVTGNLVLPTVAPGTEYAVTWAASAAPISTSSPAGVVTRPEMKTIPTPTPAATAAPTQITNNNATGKITASIQYEGTKYNLDIPVIVLEKEPTAKQKADADAYALNWALIKGSTGNATVGAVTNNLNLISSIPAGKGSLKDYPNGFADTTITWQSNNPSVISNTGVVTRQAEQATVKLVATVTNGTSTVTVVFDLTVSAIVPTNQEIVETAKAKLDWVTIAGSNIFEDKVSQSLTLPTTRPDAVTVRWSLAEGDPAVITGLNTGTGTIVPPPYAGGDKTVTLIATLSKGAGEEKYETTKTFTLTILKAAPTAVEAIAADKASLTWDSIKGSNTSQTAVTGAIALPTAGALGSMITWASSNTAVIKADGTVVRPAYESGNATVTLTATIMKGASEDTKTFSITVLKADPSAEQKVASVVEAIEGFELIKGTNTDQSKITSDLALVTSYLDCEIEWESDKEDVVATDGTITRQAEETEVTLTATVSCVNGGETITDEAVVVVIVAKAPAVANSETINTVLDEAQNGDEIALNGEIVLSGDIDKEVTLVIENEATITISNDMVIGNDVKIDVKEGGNFKIDSTVSTTLNGEITIKNNANIDVAGELKIGTNGTVTVNEGATIIVNEKPLVVEGKLKIEGNMNFKNASSKVTVSGTLEIGSVLTARAAMNGRAAVNAPYTKTVDLLGTLDIAAGGNVVVNAGTRVNMLDTSVNEADGIINVASGATLNVNGSILLGSYSKINVTGTVNGGANILNREEAQAITDASGNYIGVLFVIAPGTPYDSFNGSKNIKITVEGTTTSAYAYVRTETVIGEDTIVNIVSASFNGSDNVTFGFSSNAVITDIMVFFNEPDFTVIGFGTSGESVREANIPSLQ